ncbi:MAG: DUF2083 domain-containing protein [Alphaproteobacteria bacterium]|nr:DUF2083 domain-containing protein [Alphaproteobacteria bacterium]MBU0796043.1 DUF2083 domain-containing protein [Alphaproteobacteria bacterium]MBU0886822.1 DUF2083 domain-containing protein [Alphaproteobacteria bacterium]MBU1812436.1 DUF2083 domain-containing protein [Alphaproteobacteria bacterium]MBU2091463.1 DUF2083 domain-containing protein [Alphaproteobacteria bacterium]
MAAKFIGLKIRSLRMQAGLTQGTLARRAGISPSYLNLIESNRRPASTVLLDRIAAELAVDRAQLDGEAERRMADQVLEVSAELAASERLPELAPAEEFVGHHPGWAALLLRVYRSYQDRDAAVLALADRLEHDPFLRDSVHRMLTHVTSIRSAAEILSANDTLNAIDNRRFLEIVAGDSARLSQTAMALAAFFDSAQTRVRAATPTEKVDALIVESQNHFPELEAYADALRDAGGLARALQPPPSFEAADSEDPPSAFERLRTQARQGAAGEVAAILSRHDEFEQDDEAYRLATKALFAYAAAAMLMPYEPFHAAAERHRYDPDRLARLFGVSYEQAAHRLTTLRRPGKEGVRFAFMRADPSGFISKRLPLPHLPLPRYGNACPLWVIYGAFQTPGMTARAFGALTSGDDFLFFARAVEKQPAIAGGGRHLMSIMLACTGDDAPRIAAGDGIERRAATVPVGTTCRLCIQVGCRQRQEPPLVV